MKKYIITRLNGCLHTFVFEDEKLSLIHAYNEEAASLLGNVYIGRVQNIVNNINSAFVEIGREQVCFYSLADNTTHHFLNRKNTDKVCQGDLLLVQVSKEAMKTKAPALSSDISFNGVYVVLSMDGRNQIAISGKIKDEAYREKVKALLKPLVKNKGYSLVVRTAAEQVPMESVYEEALKWCSLAEEIQQKSISRPAFTCLYQKEAQYINDLKEAKLNDEDIIITDSDEILDELQRAFEALQPSFSIRRYEDPLLPMYKLYSLEKHLSEALNPHVWLKSGAYLIIEPTEALTVIDVNTGKFDGHKKNREDTFLKINMEAAAEIGRQLRIRNLSGIIIIDFINLEKQENKEKLIEYVKEVIQKDAVPTYFIEMTKLDLIELTRKKIKKPLHEVLSGKI